MERRNTIQREIVLNAVRSLKNHATADEIYAFIGKEYPGIGRGTVYRNLQILSEEGRIRKIEVPGGSARFDHNCTVHGHMKCIRCQKIFDVELEPDLDFRKMIRNAYEMKILDYDLCFKGICKTCQAKEQ